MKNWKTTLFGWILGVTALVTTGSVPTNPKITQIAAIVQAAAAAALGSSSKDKDVTGAGPTATRVPSGD